MKYRAKLNKRTGTVEFLGEPLPGLLLADPKRVRFSEIVPVDPVLRLAFRILRLLFGEQGRVSNWTRTWRCMWLCEILRGPHVTKRRVSRDRAQLITWEGEVWRWQRVPELWTN